MSDTVHVEKYHGAGNDFLILSADASVDDRSAFTADHCDRETGLSHPDAERTGADGVLFLAVDGSADPPRVKMTHHQPDGSIAEMCGNGVRCAALWGARELGVGRDEPAEVVVVTPAGERPSTVDDTGKSAVVTVAMGRASFEPEDVPLAPDRTDPLVEEAVAGLTVTAVNTGVPHAVTFVEDVDAVDLDSVAPPVRHADVFPEGTNVVLAAETDEGFDQRTYERGVEGETDACGTGAVAVGAVARRRGLVGDDWVTVRPPGGPLSIRVTDDEAYLRGPAVREYETTLPLHR